MSKFNMYLTRCACGASTSKSYARAHNGMCKGCFTGIPTIKKSSGDWRTEHKRKTGRCEDAPCCGCCGPQGDGDYYGVSAMDAGY